MCRCKFLNSSISELLDTDDRADRVCALYVYGHILYCDTVSKSLVMLATREKIKIKILYFTFTLLIFFFNNYHH